MAVVKCASVLVWAERVLGTIATQICAEAGGDVSAGADDAGAAPSAHVSPELLLVSVCAPGAAVGTLWCENERPDCLWCCAFSFPPQASIMGLLCWCHWRASLRYQLRGPARTMRSLSCWNPVAIVAPRVAECVGVARLESVAA